MLCVSGGVVAQSEAITLAQEIQRRTRSEGCSSMGAVEIISQPLSLVHWYTSQG